jgi:hypothetical protein
MPQHITVPPAIADLGFTIDVPDGFIQPEFPQTNVDFENPSESAPLALFSSQVALALIAVAGRPAYETGSVLQWMKYLCDHFMIDVDSFESGKTSGSHPHPAIIASARQEQNGEHFRLVMVAFEDGGRLVTAHAMCPRELWPSYGAQLSAAVQSISLTAPMGPKYDLDSMTAEGWTKVTPEMQREATEKYMQELEERRGPAEEAAAALMVQGKYDEAELTIQRVDSSINGSVSIARMYESRLKSVIKQGDLKKDKAGVEKLFHRALTWAQSCYPEPHTEIEADD